MSLPAGFHPAKKACFHCPESGDRLDAKSSQQRQDKQVIHGHFSEPASFWWPFPWAHVQVPIVSARARAGQGAQDGALGSVDDPTSPAYFNAAIGDRVLFAVDQSTLSIDAQAVLSEQANWLMTNGAYTALIEGHADEQGTQAYNLALGARRASAVQNYLISQGVAPGRLKNHQLWQGTPDRDLLGRGLLFPEPPRCHGADGGCGALGQGH